MQRKKSKKGCVLKIVGLVGAGMIAGSIIGWYLGAEIMRREAMFILDDLQL